MRISTVREFRDKATGMFRSKDPILVTRRGRLAGVFFPWTETTLPNDLKKELFAALSLANFNSWRKGRRESRGRR